MSKVGIFAGSFDPIHEGHLEFAKEAIKHCGLDKVFFLVEPRPRRKQGVRAFEHRMVMVHLATANERRFGDIVIQQPIFSVAETMPVLKRMFKGNELYLLFGDDVLKHLAAWPQIRKLAQDVSFVLASRQEKGKDISLKLKTLEQTRGIKLDYTLLNSPRAEVSSSKIRLALKHSKVPVGLPRDIVEYIKDNGLYVSSGKSS